MDSTKLLYPTYFLQTQKWIEFWQSANSGHSFNYFENESFFTFVYEYPWYFKQKFWYIPRFAELKKLTKNSNQKTNTQNLDASNLETNLKEIWQQIQQKASQEKIVFLKMDFNDDLEKFFQTKALDSILQQIRNFTPDLKINFKTKIIQFTSTMTLDLQSLTLPKASNLTSYNYKKNDDLNLDLETFFNINKNFWLKVDKDIRRSTKRSLEVGFDITTEKTSENLNIFYKLLTQTATTQNFPIQPKNYLQKLLNQNFSYLWILNLGGNPVAGWMGIEIENTLVHLYGSNTLVGKKYHSQHFLHLLAMYLAKTRNLNWYDLGGYNPSLGFAGFKNGYRGKIRDFGPVVDIIFRPLTYKSINLAINLAKLIKK